ncbi:MAG TPA: nucleotide exchange factor GrpE [Solirubrobacterales bacterium]
MSDGGRGPTEDQGAHAETVTESAQEARAAEAAREAQEAREAREAQRAEPTQGGEQRDLEDELARSEDRYRRALADLDNYRKRSSQEVERRVAEGGERMLRDWLEVVDSVDRALRMPGPVNEIAAGLRAVLEQMEAILERQGVERIGTPGDRFDPELHEAIAVRETDAVPDRTVVEVARSGYRVGDRVLRPAQVVVSRGGGEGDGGEGVAGEREVED